MVLKILKIACSGWDSPLLGSNSFLFNSGSATLLKAILHNLTLCDWLWCVLGTILINCWVCDTRMWRTWVCPPSSPPPHPPPPFTPSPHSRVSRLLACSSSLNTDITVHTTYTVQPRTLEPQTVFAQPETSVVEPEQPKAGFVVVWSWRRPFDVIQPLIKLLSFGTGTDGISKSPASKLLKQDQLLNTQHLIFLLK